MATSMFSARTANSFMDCRACSSVYSAMECPACRDIPRRRSGSQHSRSCWTLSGPMGLVAMVYSSHRWRKYSHSEAVPSSFTMGRLTGSSLVLAGGARGGGAAWGGGACDVMCPLMRAAPVASPTSGVTYSQPWIGHGTSGIAYSGLVAGPSGGGSGQQGATVLRVLVSRSGSVQLPVRLPSRVWSAGSSDWSPPRS